MNTSAYTNTSTLPPNIYELKHDDFYDFFDHEGSRSSCGTIIGVSGFPFLSVPFPRNAVHFYPFSNATDNP